MTLEELQRQHEQEWEEFHAKREERQIELWRAENDIIEALDMEQSRIPQSLRDRIDNDWQEFENEWGEDGKQFKDIIEKQRKEIFQHYSSNVKNDTLNNKDIQDTRREEFQTRMQPKPHNEKTRGKDLDMD